MPFGGDFGRSLFQHPAQNRVISEEWPGCSGHFPVWSFKPSRMGIHSLCAVFSTNFTAVIVMGGLWVCEFFLIPSLNLMYRSCLNPPKRRVERTISLIPTHSWAYDVLRCDMVHDSCIFISCHDDGIDHYICRLLSFHCVSI